MKAKKTLAEIVLLATLATACSGGAEAITTPEPTPTVYVEPTQKATETPAIIPTADGAIKWFKDNDWKFGEVNGLPPGSVSASPAAFLE